MSQTRSIPHILPCVPLTPAYPLHLPPPHCMKNDIEPRSVPSIAVLYQKHATRSLAYASAANRYIRYIHTSTHSNPVETGVIFCTAETPPLPPPPPYFLCIVSSRKKKPTTEKRNNSTKQEEEQTDTQNISSMNHYTPDTHMCESLHKPYTTNFFHPSIPSIHPHAQAQAKINLKTPRVPTRRPPPSRGIMINTITSVYFILPLADLQNM